MSDKHFGSYIMDEVLFLENGSFIICPKKNFEPDLMETILVLNLPKVDLFKHFLSIRLEILKFLFQFLSLSWAVKSL